VDTKNVFPHLVNCGKYSMTIMAAVTLSLYRITDATSTLALFATFSVVNSIYCSVWDLFMDFSVLQPDSRHRLLRDILAIKYRWVYYAIMVIDPILRFAWIFYAIFTHDKQHNSIASFLIGFAEVTRRGMWALIRVENEHCSNVAQYKASRDVPLPYKLDLEPLVERASEDTTRSERDSADGRATAVDPSTAGGPGPGEEQGAAPPPPSAQAAEEGGLRRRRKSDAFRTGGDTIRRIMADAHRQDFEKRRKPAEPPKETDQDLQGDEPSDDDDDDDSTASVLEERMDIGQVEQLVRDTRSDGGT
jgi:xenotropic and polytropic retrovirus receptor 1